MVRGSTWERQSAGRRWCGCSRPSLKREQGKHFLVTPVEKVGIRVDDAPFLASRCAKTAIARPAVTLPHQCRRLGGVRAGPWPALRMAADGGITPYLHVRADLWAKVTRALYYDLVDMGERGWSMGGEVRGRVRRRVLCEADAEQVRNAL